MNLVTVKKDSDIKLAGVTAEIERADGNIRAVVLKDAAGGMVVIRGDYGVSVQVPAPPTMVKKWKLTGSLKGLKYEEFFDSKYSADVRATELEDFESKGDVSEVEVAE
jgi:hypothetical protein